MPEGKRHLLIRTALFDLLTVAFGDRAAIGSDQFVYWNASNPAVRVAPDVMVRLGHVNDVFASWKTWERGAPHLAVEILSDPGEMKSKVPRYHELGVHELVAFDPEDAASPLRVWLRVEDDLVEQELESARTAPCETLGLHWVVLPDAQCGQTLRLARDAAGEDLLPTRAELEAKQHALAEARIRELEAELRRRPSE